MTNRRYETKICVPYFLAGCSATLLYLSSGALTGWLAPALPRLRDGGGGGGGGWGDGGERGRPGLSPEQESWVAAAAHLAHAAAALPAAALADAAGRRPALALAAAPFLACWVLTALAGVLAPNAHAHTDEPSDVRNAELEWPVVVPLLLAARVVGGVGAGATYTAGAMYLGEVAPDRVRGAVGTLFQLALNAGVMLEYCVAPRLSFTALAAASAAPAALFLAAFAFAPESPYYLLMKGRRAEAARALANLRGEPRSSEDVEEELWQIENTVEAAESNWFHSGGAGSGGIVGGVRALWGTPSHRRALSVCLGLYTAALLSGHAVVLAYATVILRRARVAASAADEAVAVLGAVQIAASAASSLLVDVVGRRPLLIASCAGCAFSLAMEGSFFYASAPESFSWLPLTALLCFIVFFTLGLGSVPVAVMSELFPTDVKAIATAFLSSYHALVSFLTVKFVVDIECELHVMFWTFSSFCVAGVVFVWFLVPETKGKTLLEVHSELQYGYLSKEKNAQKEFLVDPYR